MSTQTLTIKIAAPKTLPSGSLAALLHLADKNQKVILVDDESIAADRAGDGIHTGVFTLNYQRFIDLEIQLISHSNASGFDQGEESEDAQAVPSPLSVSHLQGNEGGEGSNGKAQKGFQEPASRAKKSEGSLSPLKEVTLYRRVLPLRDVSAPDLNFVLEENDEGLQLFREVWLPAKGGASTYDESITFLVTTTWAVMSVLLVAILIQRAFR